MKTDTNNIEINAAILEQDFSEIEAKLEQSKDLVDIAQIDICDGTYVPSKTFLHDANIQDAERLSIATTDIPLELDMMVDWSITERRQTFLQKIFKQKKPINWITVIKTLNPKRVVLHHSSITNKMLNNIFQIANKGSIEFGLGIHLDDTKEMLVARLSTYPFSYVQIMGIEKVGYGGQSQSDKLIPYIQSFRTKYPDMPISIDGGVKLENVKALKEAGATRMTIGSGLFKTDDIEKRVRDLQKETI